MKLSKDRHLASAWPWSQIRWEPYEFLRTEAQ